ncbi:hypothetical protein [Bosea sp. NPDC055594]
MTPLTTKAAEIRAGLVDRLHALASPERVKHGVPQDVAMTEAAALIEQLAAELARLEQDKAFLKAAYATLAARADNYSERLLAAEAERDELLREKERMGALARRLSDALLTVRPLGGSELFMRAGEDFYADPDVCTAEIAMLRTELHEAKVSVARERRARPALENGPAGLADGETA